MFFFTCILSPPRGLREGSASLTCRQWLACCQLTCQYGSQSGMGSCSPLTGSVKPVHLCLLGVGTTNWPILIRQLFLAVFEVAAVFLPAPAGLGPCRAWRGSGHCSLPPHPSPFASPCRMWHFMRWSPCKGWPLACLPVLRWRTTGGLQGGGGVCCCFRLECAGSASHLCAKGPQLLSRCFFPLNPRGPPLAGPRGPEPSSSLQAPTLLPCRAQEEALQPFVSVLRQSDDPRVRETTVANAAQVWGVGCVGGLAPCFTGGKPRGPRHQAAGRWLGGPLPCPPVGP
jgi:hypothetical protein